ncbi:MAG: hypothetical protein IT245_00450 [Bacteroidia bacterium]|nr:hypothetical protein [Bacteroidia bacterium]
MIIFGTYFGGKIHKVENQWIESKYFLLMGPLIPYRTMFVTGGEYNYRTGFEINMNGKSVLHGFIRFYFLIASVVLFGFAIYDTSFYQYNLFIDPKTHDSSELFLEYLYSPCAWTACICAIILAWSHFENTKAAEEETRIRTKLGAIIGINALPQWLDNLKRFEIINNIKSRLDLEFGANSIEKSAQRSDLSPGQIGLLYAYYTYLTCPREEHTPLDVQIQERLSALLDDVIAKIDTPLTVTDNPSLD